jgi:hypothetical protein
VTLDNSPSNVRDPKILKTTPCKVAGGRHGCFESELTRRANHGHSFIIPQSSSARRPVIAGAANAIAAEKSSSTLEIAPDRRGERSPARGRTARLTRAPAEDLNMDTAPDPTISTAIAATDPTKAASSAKTTIAMDRSEPGDASGRVRIVMTCPSEVTTSPDHRI